MLIPLGTALVVSACSTNPVSNKPEVTFTSTAEEKAIGADQARQVDEYMGLAGSAQQQAYIAEIGRRLAASSPRQDVTYTFKIVDMPEPNAFALPGGPVYLSRGLLALSNSEDELACVIGHEIGHVAARHHAPAANASGNRQPVHGRHRHHRCAHRHRGSAHRRGHQRRRPDGGRQYPRLLQSRPGA